MCGRTVVVSPPEVVEMTFNARVNPLYHSIYKPNYNLAVGQLGPVILSEKPTEIVFAKFGLTPSWAKKEMYLFNARAEGDANRENSHEYTGGMGIISKPSFRNLIRNRRCLVIADAFYEGSQQEGLDKPYLVYLNKRKPFALAGLYDKWLNVATGEEVLSYTIITIWANSLLHRIGHHRSPVILRKKSEHRWLRDTAPLSEITALLQPYPSEFMNCYPVSPSVKSPRNNSRELLDPTGEKLMPESELRVAE